ncbi:MAG: carboxypeptidase regulatory-like domain-containing protein, partial [Planctomycetes bacterium]|nr:carboxypeptidase regulatory-like domain-containing protein [Planctomycetota bacterium]
MKPLLLAVVVLALGFLAWFGLRGGGDTAPVPVPTQETAAGNAKTGAAAQTDLAPGHPGRSADAQAAVERSAAPVASGAGAATAVKVRGRLVDAGKAARAGVKVEMETWRNPDGIEIDGLVGWPGRGGDRASDTTRADGRFEFVLGPGRNGSIDLPDDELVFAEPPPFVRAGQEDQDLGDLVVVRCSQLGGKVQDERGLPVPGVKVAASLGAFGFGTTSSATTDAEGRFSVGKLRPGTWTLRTAP